MATIIPMTEFDFEAETRNKHKAVLDKIESTLDTVYLYIENKRYDLTDRFAYIEFDCIEPLTKKNRAVLVRIDRTNGLPEIFKR